jgi:hypothetical protein
MVITCEASPFSDQRQAVQKHNISKQRPRSQYQYAAYRIEIQSEIVVKASDLKIMTEKRVSWLELTLGKMKLHCVIQPRELS